MLAHSIIQPELNKNKNLTLLFNGRDRGIWLCFSRKDFQLDSRTDKVLATVEDPSQGRNNEYNRKSNNTVVWIEVSYVNSEVKLMEQDR